MGDEKTRFDILKNIIVDVCARQYHSDVKMFFVAEAGHEKQVSRFRMLPHVQNEVLGIHNIICDDSSKTVLYEYLFKELTDREQSKINVPHILIFLYDEYGLKNHPLSRFIETAKEIGVTFVFFGNTRADIAQGCQYLIESAGVGTARLVDTSDVKKTKEFTYEAVSDRDIDAMIQFLAPVYTEEVSLESSLTKSISLFEMLNIIAVEDIDLAARWKYSKVYQSMAVPIGVSKNATIYLDLHDKAHGPHGLVAGTTGAGKSELLQTYIISMATLYHPYEVGFVIIDFKGGGMANQFRDLPHMVGTITNIDGKEINRSLKSIKAELKKRQRLFAEAEVNHIDKYIQKFRKGQVQTPLPHLILVVDEFAELKADQPEFMKELISAARIGRSLGVHLILATQKPSGQVDEQIWSNSRFKLCLKVQSQQDSNEVLKSPLAAEIKEPGRAYLQVGNNEIFELFQSAYSGASIYADDSEMKEFAIYEITKSGRRVVIHEQKKKKGNDNAKTQLDALTQYIKAFCQNNHLKKLPNICLPSLCEVIEFPHDSELECEDYRIIADLGIYDDPDNQIQNRYSFDLSSGNMIIIGSSQSGKTNLLQTIIRSITTKYTPEQVNIYILDFASMILKNFEDLNHVGGVVTASEDEKLKNLFKMIFSEIKTRKEKLLSIGVSSYRAYLEAGKSDMPLIVLMVDNLTALREIYFQENDELLEICREGTSVGLCVILANSQTAGIGYKYLSNFSTRIAMFNNDSSEYSSLFDHCSERISDIKGRAIVEVDKVHLECQMFLAFKGDKEYDRVKNIKTYVEERNSHYRGINAVPIPMLPNILNQSAVFSKYKNEFNSYNFMAGLGYSNVMPVWLKLNQLGAIAISGKSKSGKHNYMKYVVETLELFYTSSDVYIVDSINRKLGDLREYSTVKQYEVLPDKVIDIIDTISKELSYRYKAVASGDNQVFSSSRLILLILNSRDAVEMISNDAKTLEAYNDIISKYKNMNVCVIVSDFENAKVSYTSPEVYKGFRDAKHFIFFDDLANMKIIDDIPMAVIRENSKQLETGDAYYIRENTIVKIKTPLTDNRAKG